MPENRFFADQPFQELQRFALDKLETHHLIQVMRKNVGQTVEVVNGKGVLALAKITQADKKKVILEILSIVKEEPIAENSLILIQAIPLQNRLATIIEKGTELGVDEFWLFPGEKSERKIIDESRLHAIVIAALKQCGRLFYPKIVLKPPLKKWAHAKLQGYFGHCNEKAPFLPIPLKQLEKQIMIAIGPEGGFSPEEIKLFTSFGLTGIRLSKNILRTDTAAIAAISSIKMGCTRSFSK